MSKTTDVINYLASLEKGKCKHNKIKICNCKCHVIFMFHDRNCCDKCDVCGVNYICDHDDEVECKCLCHDENNGMIHFVSCCDPCLACKFKSKRVY